MQHVIALTQARWRDMPQQRGVTIDLRVENEPDLSPILGVESELREALINLVFNAVDALPEGGSILVRTRRAAPASERIAIEVIDDGVGMDELTRQRCLEPFFTTKGDQGTGLGLAMVYGVVRRHGGDIEIESAPSKGTTVRLIFAAATSGVTTSAGAGLPETPSRRLRLLIIDDDPILLRSLREVLGGEGHSVIAAADGAEGLAAFSEAREAGKNFDAVITDLGMPKMDGRRVAAAIKDLDATVPILLLTGWGERLIAEEERLPHIDQVLSKPPKLRDIRLALAECCEVKADKRAS
jgi:CheY-like chemotaxis protein